MAELRLNRRLRIAGVCLALAMGCTVPASAQDVTQDGAQRGYITGQEWQRSAERSKLAYVLGVADLMNAEYALQSRGGRSPASGSAMARFHDGFSTVSIREAVNRVDAFYAANPELVDETVLEALWITLVEETQQ